MTVANERLAPGTYVALTGGLALMVVPFILMAVSSIMAEAEVRAVPPTCWPE
ncbi:MAG: carbohydrate ABC transporter permease, partial [Nocardioidaceae bacterium]|nr:carbohydrate ABC transporter permease [Nocardioidaceae bacterium]